jgi:hypothetical protein
VPLVALCFWIGVYPKPFLAYLHGPVKRVAAIVQPAKFGPGAALAASPLAADPHAPADDPSPGDPTPAGR